MHFIDNEWIARPIYLLAQMLRGGNQLGWTIDTAMAWPSYVIFEHMVRSEFGRRLQRGEFDLIRRITPLSPTAVSPLASKTDMPMIAAEIPRHFYGLRFLHPENDVDPARFPIATRWAEPSGRFRFVTVGRLVP
ncbi:MAG: hypothetical protein EXS09_16970 [Gemmataceae bacterium]|nr:hypothetical protein [Gemmataceae bacterium]